jgi:hypothetical protein
MNTGLKAKNKSVLAILASQQKPNVVLYTSVRMLKLSCPILNSLPN